MPQLNPSPWFMLMVFSWLVFATVLVPKTMSHTFLNDPVPQSTQDLNTESWSWPWSLASSTNL